MQTCTGFQKTERTIHILSHHAGQSPVRIQEDFMRWVPQHMNWICQASSYLLKKRKLACY